MSLTDGYKWPEEWEVEFGYRIKDADGWISAGIPWKTRITRELFEQLSGTCTIELIRP